MKQSRKTTQPENAAADGDAGTSASRAVDGYIRKNAPWREVLEALRSLALEAGMAETVKWRTPCYMHAGGNVVLIGAGKDHCVLSFLKGSLLEDERKLLEKPGENSQAARVIRLTDAKQVASLRKALEAYLREAMTLEEQGRKVAFRKEPEPMPPELREALAADAAYKAAFESLTPGRQRGYILHFAGAKQSATRAARIAKYRGQILQGLGMHDDYRAKVKSRNKGKG